FLIAVFGLNCSAQDTYTKIYDNPDEAMKGHIGVEFYGVDFGAKNISGAMLFTIGVNAAYPLTDRIIAEGTVRVPLLRFEKEGMGFITEAGGMLALNTQKKQKTATVILSYSEKDIFGTNKRLATTKFVRFPGEMKFTTLLRGGFYLKNTAIE